MSKTLRLIFLIIIVMLEAFGILASDDYNAAKGWIVLYPLAMAGLFKVLEEVIG